MIEITTPFKKVSWVFVIALCVMFPAQATDVQDLNTSCYNDTHTEISGLNVSELTIINNCYSGNQIYWPGETDLSLGVIMDGEVDVGDDWMFVDSSLRPDLDKSAQLIFKQPPTVTDPVVYEDGVQCGDCNVTHTTRQTTVDVTGFSNYSLQGQKEFTVYDDDKPELKNKVYQVVDLGDSNRNQEFACSVQVFGRNDEGDWVLVQTNPERKAVGNVLGDPDTNQPESLGYFPTKNGMANTYFRAGLLDNIVGYSDFNLVIQCTDTAQKLVWEDGISTRYSPAGRTVTARGVWFTDGNNATYMAFYAIFGLFALWFGAMIWRSITGR